MLLDGILFINKRVNFEIDLELECEENLENEIIIIFKDGSTVLQEFTAIIHNEDFKSNLNQSIRKKSKRQIIKL